MKNIKAVPLAEDLRTLADMIETHSDTLPDNINFNIYSYLWKWSSEEGIPEVLATTMRSGLKTGAVVTKTYDDDRFRLKITMPNQKISYEISAEREEVCTKRVTGTEMVEKSIPPEGEWVTKMVEQEVVEWDCHPLLAVTKED